MAKIYLDLKIMDWMELLHAVSRKARFTEKISIDGWHAWNDIEKNIYMSEINVCTTTKKIDLVPVGNILYFTGLLPRFIASRTVYLPPTYTTHMIFHRILSF